MKKVFDYILSIHQKLNNFIQLRWTKRRGTTNVFGRIVIINPKNIILGNGCSINHGAYLNAFNPIHIGDDVTISAGAKLISTGIDYKRWMRGKKQHTSGKGIWIGDHVWIGANAIILENVSITGEYVIIAANAVVNKSIHESFVLVGGCPATIIKRFTDGE